MRDVTQLSALELSAKIEHAELTSVQVTSAFLERIEEFNPKINAIVGLRARSDILADARRADESARRGWLHGIPLAIKDLAETKGMRTTFGSPLFAEHTPTHDSLMVQRIKDAGAVLIGKTNTPEFGLGSHTFNPVYGATRNPYALDLSAGGSSGGAAAALAARLVPVADGSDMMGSLRNPAAFCNVYGFRPSWGLVPADPTGEMFLQQLATSGPMGRSPADIAALLQTMAGPDPRIPYDTGVPPDFRDLRGSVSGKRIGWLADWQGAYPCEDGILSLCETGLSAFDQLGCSVEPVMSPFDAMDLWWSWRTLRAWANASKMKETYDDPDQRALLKPEMIWEIEQGLSLSARDVHDASTVRSAWFRKFIELSSRYDAFALPSAQVWPFPVEWTYPKRINGTEMDTYHRWMEIVIPVSLIGLPCLAIPAGFSAQGLPMGLQLFGPRGSDRQILTLGHAYHTFHDWTEQAPDL
ncbi:amidase [Roseobacter sinensis]|uniref:Amidase n=1 Tax=Roseobacter sinensis TaxID=2931391 RepID=A0ABT3BCE7_9RHOB|nr:amidase [Roseobacter sp. WL0113]MCV3271243.1 amidase [Roseobacter sp. WL0113]